MITKEEVYQSLDEIMKKFDDPEVKEKFRGFKRDIQFKFPDIGANYVLRISENASAALVEEEVGRPDITIETDSETFLDIRRRKMSGVQAYMSGRLKVRGSMPDLLKLQRLM
jgi:putative sterol carrier protein